MTYLSDDEWYEAMLKAEDAILAHNTEKILKYFVTIEMDNQPFRVRIFRAGDSKNKPLVLLGGYHFALRLSNIFDDLAKRYNLFVIE